MKAKAKGVTIMYKLPSSAFDQFRHFQPPGTWQEMQSFCLDAFPLVQEKFSTGRPRTANYWASSGYGKNGDKQHGVDIFDHFSTTTMQCKRVDSFDLPHLKKELELLKGYRSPLSAHFIVTSLEETNRTVTDYVREHNDAMVCNTASGQVPPMLAAERLPKLYVLNWPDIRNILCTDSFLVMKWQFCAPHVEYPDLNGVDLRSLIWAANTMDCSIPPGRGRKSHRVLAAIRALTQSLDADQIELLGGSETVSSTTIHAMRTFQERVNETATQGLRVKPVIAHCESLDGVQRQNGLRNLNTIVPFLARIEAFKYLNRIAGMVDRLLDLLDNEHSFVFGHMDEECEGRSFTVENEWIRHYNFTNDDVESQLWYIPREKIVGTAQMIARELRKVRGNWS
jgi:hypothetical protein